MFRFLTGVVQSYTRQDINKDDTIEIKITVIVNYCWSATWHLYLKGKFIYFFQYVSCFLSFNYY